MQEVLKGLRLWNGQPLVQEPHQHVVHTDASEHALGGHVDGIWVHEEMCLPEREESSTFRELLAILMLVRKLRHLYKGRKLLFRTDNQAAYYILTKGGSTKEHIMVLVRRMYSLLWQARVRWDIEWIPRESNVRADYISKLWDHEDWGISMELFEWLDDL